MIVKYIVIGAIAITTIWISRSYASFVDTRLGEMRGISNLILHIESKLSRSLEFGVELYRDFSDDFLEKCGFLANLREGKSLKDAFSAVKGKMLLPSGVVERTEELFSSFGREYKDREIDKLRLARGEINKELEGYSEDLEKNKRVTNAILFGIAASLAIILM